MTEASDPIEDHPDGATVRLRVVPRARRTAFAGRHGDAYRVKVAAPPVDGAANAEVRRFVADLAGVRTADVLILSGERARDKVVLVRGGVPAQLREALETS